MTISMDKQYRTRDGHEVRIYAVDGYGSFSVHGAIKARHGWEFVGWQADGRHRVKTESHYDLIEVKPRIRREYWVNVYEESEKDRAYSTREIADNYAVNYALKNRVACVKVVIDCEEGEGL